MAEFKKVPDGDSGEGPFAAINAEAVGQFATSYWPAVLGGVTLFILIVMGKERAAIPVGIAVVLLQGWLIIG